VTESRQQQQQEGENQRQQEKQKRKSTWHGNMPDYETKATYAKL